jgi:hypothetical protein
MAEIVNMNHPMRPGPIEIDDSRLQTLWARQNRRNLWVAGTAGATAILVGAALVIMALRFNTETPVVNVAPPVVNVPAPVVNIEPKIEVPAPIVNVTPKIEVQVPQQLRDPSPAMTPRTGESKVVSEHVIFHSVTIGDYLVYTGWKFHNSKEAEPYTQYCYALIGRTARLELAIDGKISPTIANEARTAGVDPAKAMAFTKSCRWFGQS